MKFRFLACVSLLALMAACDDDSSTGATAGNSSSGQNVSRPKTQSKEFFCTVTDTEDGFKEELNFPNRFYATLEVSKSSDAVVESSIYYAFYGVEAMDFPKTCRKMDEDKNKFVEGSYVCENDVLTYKSLRNYGIERMDDATGYVETLRENAERDCASKYEWYLDDMNEDEDD